MSTVHIIGAGISGLAAATALAEKHIPVKLYEATAHAGGRCRSSAAGDHGLHIISEYDKELQRYLARIGPPAFAPVAALPLPHAALADYLPLLGWLLRPKGKANEAIARDSQLRDGWLRPLARVAYGTAHEAFPAQALRPYLWRRAMPKLRMAQSGLSDSYIQPALDYLDYHGGSIYFGHALTRIERDDEALKQLVFARKKVVLASTDIVILATPPAFTQTLLPTVSMPVQAHSAITMHFHTPHREADGIAYPLDLPMDLLRYREGVISASSRLADGQWQSDPELLAHRVWRGLQQLHGYLQTVAMPRYTIWREKRAGHAVADMPPLPVEHGPLLLAGDWLDPCQAASLEAAAASGHRAATRAMEKLPTRPHRQQ